MKSHYVPSSYLRRFTDERGRLWVFDKATGKAFWSSPRNIAKEEGFYRRQDERDLAGLVESPVGPVLRKVSNREAIDLRERLLLAVFMAVQLTRVPRFRDDAWRHLPEVMSATFAKWIHRIRRSGESSGETAEAAEQVRELERVWEEYAASPPQDVVDFVRSPWPTRRRIAMFWNMPWCFACTTGANYYVSTDNPVFLFESYGLGSPKSEISFPISKSVALMGSKRLRAVDCSYVDVPDSIVREVNARLVSTATRFVFYYRSVSWISKIAAKPDRGLSHIDWLLVRRRPDL